MVENEFKIMLTNGQYEKLLSLYDFKTIVQTNHYYDTDDLELSEIHVTVRVREVSGRFFLQMKLPTDVKYSRVELERELEEIPNALSGDELKTLCGREMPDIKRLGALTTTRNIHKFDGGEIDVDKSEYFGVVDYELEIEFSDEEKARAVLDEIKHKLGIRECSDVCVGKVRRFLAARSKR